MAEEKPKGERYRGGRGKPKSLSPRKLAFALLCLSNVPQKEAAKQAGFSEHTAKDLINDPLVQQFMESHPKSVQTELAKQEATKIMDIFGAFEAALLDERFVAQRLQQIIAGGPDEKGTYASQLEGIKMYLVLKGYLSKTKQGAEEGATVNPDGSVRFYRSAWLIKQQANQAALPAKTG
jgi:hypothetical protein